MFEIREGEGGSASNSSTSFEADLAGNEREGPERAMCEWEVAIKGTVGLESAPYRVTEDVVANLLGKIEESRGSMKALDRQW